MIEDSIEYNSAYISLNLLDELDYCLGGYGKPSVEFLFSLNTFVESFIASSGFYTSLDELNHLNLTAPALFPNGRPILNLVVREAGLKFVNGVVNNPGREIYRGDALGRTRKEAQQDFVIEYGKKIQDQYLIRSDIRTVVEKIPLVTSKHENDYFIVSEVLNTSAELVTNLTNVAKSSSIQTTLPIYLYRKQINALTKKPESILALDRVAKIHMTTVNELIKFLDYQYLPIPPFTNILLSQVTSISEIPQKLSQLRADFHELRSKFIELEKEIFESDNIKQQIEIYRNFKEFWSVFEKKYPDKKHRIFYGSLDLINGSDFDKSADSLIDGSKFDDSITDLNLGKLGANFLKKGFSLYNDQKIINRFKGLTNIWELFETSKSINQQMVHFERLFSVKFSNDEISRVQDFIKIQLTDIPNTIKNS